MANVGRGYSPVTAVSLPSDQELAIQRNTEARQDPRIAKRALRGMGYTMTAEDAIGAAALMDRSRVVSPFAGLPTAASGGQFFEAVEFFGEKDGSGGSWDEFWDDTQGGYDYQNLSWQKNGNLPVEPTNAARAPAQISQVPTSTTNPERPRTVAAGYDKQRAVLTVVFRDGTFYNYYEVLPSEWQAFKARRSKGRYIRLYLDKHPRGVANVNQVPIYAREALYRIARTGQWSNDGQRAGQTNRSRW